MTTLTITPDAAKKKLKLAGTVASGEKVSVTVVGFGTASTGSLQLRAMAGDAAVGVFPLEDEDEWTVSGSDLTCTFNLATEQAERLCKFGAEVCFVLEDTETPQLYGVADFTLLPWIKLAGVDVPVNLDNYKVKFSEICRQLDGLRTEIEKKYEKPSAGIPKSDLAPAVRTSLDKADAVTLKVPKSAFDSLLGLSLPDSSTQKDTRQMVQRILSVLQNAAVCFALAFALPAFGIDADTAWEDVPPQNKVKGVVEQFAKTPGNYEVVSNRAMNAVQLTTNKNIFVETANVSGGGEKTSTGSIAHGEIVVANAGKGVYAGGVSVTATYDGAHAEGVGSKALQEGAHAEGYNTRASGYEAHAEGGLTEASGEASHAEGFCTIAAGVGATHAAGVRANATNDSAFVWQGTNADPGQYSSIPMYGSHGKGTFNVNPVNGLYGFWIGNMNLYSHISTTVGSVVTKSYVEGLGISSDETDPVWTADKPNYATHEDVSDALTDALTSHEFTNTVRSVAGSLWDEPLQVVWQAEMRNGSLYYIAVTNENTNAEN